MLSQDDRERIRAEEIFREEVRASLAATKRPNRIWTVLNSAFTLWLLSSVGIGGITWIYQTRQAREQARVAAQRRHVALITEITFRLQPIDEMHDFGQVVTYLAAAEAGSISRSTLNEYRTLTLQSLFTELGPSVLARSFQAIRKQQPAQDVTKTNLEAFQVFCYHLNNDADIHFGGALAPPPGLIEENGRLSPLDIRSIPGIGMVTLVALGVALLAPIVAMGLAGAALARQPRVPLNWLTFGCAIAALFGQGLLFLISRWL
jgi:hypothetical protein